MPCQCDWSASQILIIMSYLVEFVEDLIDEDERDEGSKYLHSEAGEVTYKEGALEADNK